MHSCMYRIPIQEFNTCQLIPTDGTPVSTTGPVAVQEIPGYGKGIVALEAMGRGDMVLRYRLSERVLTKYTLR
ncbi:hypothetical protein KIPB_006185 [Kipferlia bialata]|uniref:Uncharacterized protein n=1 Tax=Kipferlia bialata TaxID=797122 RepID=A0A9K3CZT2_9EUKA|nr:hypothetical protein KIPB_006185 [Kipferlia bialata]|eukprot:g6185.t1